MACRAEHFSPNHSFGRNVLAWHQRFSAVGMSGNSTCDGLA